MPKAISLRELARQDIEEAIDHYLDEAGPKAALDFIEALETAYSHLVRQPSSGSPRYAHELNIPGLRFWPLSRFPYLIFYFERDDHVDVWRVMHQQRDIPAWMNDA
jgi:toxin ParE1/3/4